MHQFSEMREREREGEREREREREREGKKQLGNTARLPIQQALHPRDAHPKIANKRKQSHRFDVFESSDARLTRFDRIVPEMY